MFVPIYLFLLENLIFLLESDLEVETLREGSLSVNNKWKKKRKKEKQIKNATYTRNKQKYN